MPRGPLWQTCTEQRQALWGHYEWQCKGVEVRRDSIAAVLSSRSLANVSQVQRWDPERSQAQIMPIIALFNSTNTLCVSLETALLKKKGKARKPGWVICGLMSCVLSLLVPQCERQSRKIRPGSIMKQEGGFPAPPAPTPLCHCKCQDFGSEHNQFQVSQPESLTARTKTGALPGFCLFLSLAGMSVVVNNASFSPSPDNDRHFSFVKTWER